MTDKPVLLAVDDDPQVLAAVRRDLRTNYREHYSVIGAQSGAEALETAKDLKARGAALAMVISDQRMPGMLGVELLAQVREIYPDARRVLLTAYSEIDAAVRAINEAHLDYYLSKPWDPPTERLYPVVDDLLDTWQAEYLPEAPGLRLIGHQWSPRSHDIKDFLASSLVPYHWLDIGRDPEARRVLDAAGVAEQDLPALFFEDGTVLRNPEPRQVAECLGRSMAAAFDVYDLVVVGAGPAGLAAAVYGASEGLRTLILDRNSPGGQAGASMKIENYLGFPTGITGATLTANATLQAQKFDARFSIPSPVSSLARDGEHIVIDIEGGERAVARCVLIATGADYRRLDVPGRERFEGLGVYYEATPTELGSCRDVEVVLVGGGNSAGQAAVFLSEHLPHVILLVRGGDLRADMSSYLVERIEDCDNIEVLDHTQIREMQGGDRLERVVVENTRTGATRTIDTPAVFTFIGAVPRTEWLPREIETDRDGYVRTGRSAGDSPNWTRPRPPFLLETSWPGVFAAGDVRRGSVKRVASAVGEGSMAVKFVHEYLAEVSS